MKERDTAPPPPPPPPIADLYDWQQDDVSFTVTGVWRQWPAAVLAGADHPAIDVRGSTLSA